MTFIGDGDHDGMVLVPLAYDDAGRPVEWVWVPSENAADWDARGWEPMS